MNDDELLRYSRHILLNELGIEGQERLLISHAAIIGAGGLGCAAALYLASSGVGRLTLIDDDSVDLTNLQRQIAHTTDRVGHSKVSSLASAIKAINPAVKINCIESRANAELLNSVLNQLQTDNQVDVVLDCSDNFKTRHLVNLACVRHATPLISGSALKMDGQLSTFQTKLSESPCYACLFPPDEVPEEVSCSTMGVFGVSKIGLKNGLKKGLIKRLIKRLIKLHIKQRHKNYLRSLTTPTPTLFICRPRQLRFA